MKILKYKSYSGLLLISAITVSVCIASSWVGSKRVLTTTEMGSVYGGACGEKCVYKYPVCSPAASGYGDCSVQVCDGGWTSSCWQSYRVCEEGDPEDTCDQEETECGGYWHSKRCYREGEACVTIETWYECLGDMPWCD